MELYNNMIYIGEVVDIEDPQGGDRIKVRLLPEDKLKSIEDIDFAFPLLPKQFHVKPKVGESVFVICAVDGIKATQRYYIGPIISQPQDMYYDDAEYGATKLLKHGLGKPKQNIQQSGEAKGALAKDDEIALYSRQNSDIILSNNDIRIRCGARLLDPQLGNQTGDNIFFNKQNPSFIKLKYHTTPLENKLQPKTPDSFTTATIVADEIALLSNKSKDPMLSNGELYDEQEQISDENLQKIINEAHVLPYGDVLVDFLMGFLQMFKAHTHQYHGQAPFEDDFAKSFDAKFGRGTRSQESSDYNQNANNVKIENVNSTFRGLYDKLLSKNVRIN